MKVWSTFTTWVISWTPTPFSLSSTHSYTFLHMTFPRREGRDERSIIFSCAIPSLTETVWLSVCVFDTPTDGVPGVWKSSRKLHSEGNSFSSKTTAANALPAVLLLPLLRVPTYSPGAWAKEGSCFIFFSYCLHLGVIKPWPELFNLNSAVLGCCHWQENTSRTPENLELCSSMFTWCVYESPRHHRGQTQSMHWVCGRRILLPSHSGACIK